MPGKEEAASSRTQGTMYVVGDSVMPITHFHVGGEEDATPIMDVGHTLEPGGATDGDSAIDCIAAWHGETSVGPTVCWT